MTDLDRAREIARFVRMQNYAGSTIRFAQTEETVADVVASLLASVRAEAEAAGRRAGFEALGAAVRAAKLALFVIRKQGVMPNASWERGFNHDLATAEAALRSLSPEDTP